MWGNGDSTLILVENKKILVDGGGNANLEKYDVGTKVLLPYLLDREINELDYIFISHFDADHCNGLISVLDKLNVENIVITKQSKQSTEYLNIIEIAQNKKTNIIFLKQGDKIQFNKHTYITCLYPYQNPKFDDLNNNSMVLKLTHDKFNMIFTGDIEEEAEKLIYDEYKFSDILDANVIKIAHHGSKTSTTKEFLKLVSPEIALIGVGKDNTFGHPNVDVISRLEQMNTKIYRTDNMGEIHMWINRNGKIQIETHIE